MHSSGRITPTQPAEHVPDTLTDAGSRVPAPGSLAASLLAGIVIYAIAFAIAAIRDPPSFSAACFWDSELGSLGLCLSTYRKQRGHRFAMASLYAHPTLPSIQRV